MNEKMKKIKCGLGELLNIFSSLKSVFLFLIFTILFGLLLIILPNISVVGAALSGSGNSMANFLDVTAYLFTGFLPVSQVSTVLISALFGVNLVLFINLRKRNKKLTGKTATTATGGFLFSILGAGCGACGVLAVSFLSFFGMGSLVGVLPFGGAEFDIAGVILLVVSLILILNALIENNCKISHGK